MPSLRDHDIASQGPTIRKLSRVAEKLSDSANPDVVYCAFCKHPFKMSKYLGHSCKGRRLKYLYGEAKAKSILEAERKERQARRHRINEIRPKIEYWGELE